MDRPMLFRLAFLVASAATTSQAPAAPYKIVDLGTLPGTSSSVATSINNRGQVVGISYNNGDGAYAPVIRANGNPGRFLQNGDGARSFQYGGGSMTAIAPTGGLATAINDAGQVVGGPYTSINTSGQYVGSQYSGVQPYFDQRVQDPPAVSGGLQATSVSNGVATGMDFIPYAVNDAGVIVGTRSSPPDASVSHSIPFRDQIFSGMYPVAQRDGQVQNILWKPGTFAGVDYRAVDVNNHNDVLINQHLSGVGITFSIYNLDTQKWTNSFNPPAGEFYAATAINDAGQVVGNGFFYDGSTLQKLTDLLPTAGGWSDLNATDVNDEGWIVGQGTIDGELHAFLMTPVPEPGSIIAWTSIAVLSAVRLRRG